MSALARRRLSAALRAATRRPRAVLALGLALLAVALGPASRIEVRSDLTALLAPDDPAVVELARTLHEVGVASKLYLVLESDAPHAARGCGDILASRLRAVGAPVTSAETGIHAARAFLLPRALLFAPVAELERARALLAAQRDRAVMTGFMGGDLDDEPPAALDVVALRSATTHTRGWASRFPDGYFESTDGKALVVVVTTSVPPAALSESEPVLRALRRLVAAAAADAACNGVRAGYAGDLVTATESYRAVRADLLEVGTVGIGLVLGVVFLFFFRIRALAALALALAVGLGWTFGLASIVVGHLTTATGFLASIVAGNGLNAGIMLTSRTFEESRRGLPVGDAVTTAMTTTWRATLGAAVASAAAYGSLAVTGFQALVELAFIGAAGMLACWVATYLVVPPFLVLCERWLPFERAAARGGVIAALRMRGLDFGVPLAALAPRAPRLLALVWAAIVVLGVALGARHAQHGIVERDLRRVRADLVVDGERARLVALASEILGRAADAPILILAPAETRVPDIRQALIARRNADSAHAPFGEVHALLDLVAPDQERKLEILAAIEKDLAFARRHHAIADADWASIAPSLPPPDLRAYGVDDLPDDILPAARKSGRGRIVLVEPAPNANEYDLDDLLRLADALRELRLADGSIVRGRAAR